MRDSNRTGNQIWVERVPRVLAEELRIRGKQAGVQNLQHAREIDFGILGVGMIAMDAESGSAQKYESR